MANRRMFSLSVVGSDQFLDMSAATRELYFQLGMYADDDGFVSPRKVQRLCGASADDMKVLAAKKFVIPFESGVIVIRHWNENNYLQKDRYKPSLFTYEYSQLKREDNVYILDTECTPSIGKVSIGKVVSVSHETREITQESSLEEGDRPYLNSAADLDHATDLWRPVNPAYNNWYTKNKTERGYLDRLLSEEGMDWLEEVVPILPTVNGTPYFPTITKPSALYNKRAELKGAIERYRTPVKSKGRGFEL